MRLTRADLDAARTRTLPDVVGERPRLLFVGINPGLRSTAVGAPFGGGSNRFYPALWRAGIIDHPIDASDGLRPDDRAHLVARGVGITSLVSRPTARADELTSAELVAGVEELTRRVIDLAPAVVAMLGVTSFRVAFRRPQADFGPQPDSLGGSTLWVVPNPSGLNRSYRLDDLAHAYRQAALAADITPYRVD